MADGVILSKSSSHLDFDTISKCPWLLFAVDYIKLKTKKSSPSPEFLPWLSSKRRCRGLTCKEFDARQSAVSQLKCEQPSLATPSLWQPDNLSDFKINLLNRESGFSSEKVILRIQQGLFWIRLFVKVPVSYDQERHTRSCWIVTRFWMIMVSVSPLSILC